jgi:hypothetical protein
MVESHVAGMNHERHLGMLDELALGRGEHVVDVALELVRKDMKVADETPFMAGVDYVQATVLLGRIREGESYRDDGGGVQETGLSVVLMRSDGSISRWQLQQKNVLE